MILSVIIMAAILILTYVIKRKWQSITGLVIDLLILAITIPDVIDIFNVPETEEAGETLGYAIGLSMFGPIIVVLFVSMIAIAIVQATTIKKYKSKVVTMMDVLYESPEGKQYHTQSTKEGYSNFINNAVNSGYKIIHTYEVKVNK